jgi:hypothetical protein
VSDAVFIATLAGKGQRLRAFPQVGNKYKSTHMLSGPAPGGRNRPDDSWARTLIRMLFDWLVTGQVVATNPAHAVRAKACGETGKTAVLNTEQARKLELCRVSISSARGGTAIHSIVESQNVGMRTKRLPLCRRHQIPCDP